MTKGRIRTIGLGNTIAIAACVGCVFDDSGIPEAYYETDIDVYACDIVQEPLDIELISPRGGCARFMPPGASIDARAGFKVGSHAYCPTDDKGGFSPFVVEEIDLPELKGAGWIQLERRKSTQVPVEFRIGSPVKAVYIATESRTAPLPNLDLKVHCPPCDSRINDCPWLCFEGPSLTLSGDPSKQLYVYEYLPTPSPGDTLSIPPLQDPYIVIVEPVRRGDCSNGGRKVETETYATCTSADPTNDVLEEVSARYSPEFHRFVTRSRVVEVPCSTASREVLGLESSAHWFVRDSLIDFEPADSVATIRLGREDTTTGVTGNLHFQYEMNEAYQLTTMTISSMTLEAEPIATPLGEAEDIVIALLSPVDAVCSDSSPGSGRPCDSYEISAGSFVVGMSARFGRQTIGLVGANAQPLVIDVDHSDRSFRITGGPISVRLETGRGAARVPISIDLLGRFANFSPVAVSLESDPVANCAERANETPIRLDASASFEIYGDPLPSNPANYVWYEDFGLATEHFWGEGETVEIPAHVLSYGVHDLTLVLSDDYGIVDTDSFAVRVEDTTGPILNAPSDVVAIRPADVGGPVVVELGSATATDACSDAATVWNDAPVDSRFPIGVTEVTWYAADGHGNTTTHIQTVTVLVTEGTDLTAPPVNTPAALAQDSTAASDECFADTEPPVLRLPADIIVQRTRAPVPLDIGVATATDNCSPTVRIRNDAPKDSVFQAGETAVTWIAEDSAGNRTSGIQTILVELGEEQAPIRGGVSMCGAGSSLAIVTSLFCLLFLQAVSRRWT